MPSNSTLSVQIFLHRCQVSDLNHRENAYSIFFDPNRVVKYGLQTPNPVAVSVDTPPAPVLIIAQAAEQFRSIAKLQFDDPVHV
jgi:hypothetical protein